MFWIIREIDIEIHYKINVFDVCVIIQKTFHRLSFKTNPIIKWYILQPKSLFL